MFERWDIDIMQFYFAPLEGITGYIYRNAFHQHFDKMCDDKGIRYIIDKYYTPFLSPGNHKKLISKERNDVNPENNRGICIVPQILTNDAGCFLRTAHHLQELGYREVNLNLGCPSGTVVAKHKGAGMLADLRKLDVFLKDIFAHAEMAISIKTRIGMDDVEEWPELIKVFNQYPVKKLIVHPRLRSDFYRGAVRQEQFAYAMEQTDIPLCYNGDIFTVQDYKKIQQCYPGLHGVMLGRGLLANPALVRQIHSGQPVTQTEFLQLHNSILNAYENILSGDRNLLFKMKELWNYWIYLFDDSAHNMKRIRKAQSKQEYMMVVSKIVTQGKISTQGYSPS